MTCWRGRSRSLLRRPQIHRARLPISPTSRALSRPPASILEAGGPDFANVVEFQSLSKRSNLPGLRIGFAAGDRNFLAGFLELRDVAAPQVPMPAQRVAM